MVSSQQIARPGRYCNKKDRAGRGKSCHSVPFPVRSLTLRGFASPAPEPFRGCEVASRTTSRLLDMSG